MHLAATSFAIGVGVLPLAVGADWTAVVDVVAKLAHVLDHHVDAVGVALAQVAAAGIVGAPAAEPYRAVADVVAAFALLAEAVVLELQHRRERKGVVGAGDVDVLRTDPGVGPQDVLGIVASHGRDWAGLIVHVEPRLVATADDAADERRCMAAVARVGGAGDDDGVAVVGLDAAIEQVQRLADDAARQHVGDREALLVERLGIVRGVLAVDRLDGGDLLRPGAVIVHVTHERRAEHLSRALPAIRAAVQHVARHRRRCSRPGAADAHLREAVHGAEDRHRLAHAGLDEAHRHPDQRLGRRAAAEHVHVEVEPHAEIAGDERREHRIPRLVRQHPVDVGRLEPRVFDRVAHRPGGERARRPPRAAHVVGLADPDDRVFVAQIFGTGRVDIAR